MKLCPLCGTTYESDDFKFCPADGRQLVVSVIGPSKDRFGLATRLHERFCHTNHEDGCGWDWEGNKWDGYAHKEWLKKADSFLEAADRVIRTCHGSAHETEPVLEEILKVVEIF